MPEDYKQEKDARYCTLWEPVDVTPEEIACACMQGPPKKQRDYLKSNRGKRAANKR